MTGPPRSAVHSRRSAVAGAPGRLRPRFLNPKGSHFSGGSTIQTGARRQLAGGATLSGQARTSNECKGTYTLENSQSKGGDSALSHGPRESGFGKAAAKPHAQTANRPSSLFLRSLGSYPHVNANGSAKRYCIKALLSINFATEPVPEWGLWLPKRGRQIADLRGTDDRRRKNDGRPTTVDCRQSQVVRRPSSLCLKKRVRRSL